MHASSFHSVNARETGNFNYLSHIFFGDLTRSILPIDSIAIIHTNWNTTPPAQRLDMLNGMGKKKSRDFNCMS